MLLALMPLVMFSSCDEDEPLPETATIHGTITIDNAELWSTWKDSGVVEITIFPTFVDAAPPAGAGWGPISPNILYPGFPGGTFALGAPWNAQNPVVLTYVPGQTQYDYEIEVDPGTYSALAIGFRHNLITNPSKKSASLGVHWGMPTVLSHGIVLKEIEGGQIVTKHDYPAPATITVVKGDVVELNFKADFDFVNAWDFR